MKKRLLGAAALISLVLPTAAEAATGHIDLSYAGADIEGVTSHSSDYGIAGAVNFNLSHDFDVQADANLLDVENGSNKVMGRASLHLLHREPTFAYGFFVSDEQGPSGTGQTYDTGAEAQFYVERVNFDAGVSFAKIDGLSDDGARLRFGMDFFPTDDFSFGAHAQDLEGSHGNLTVLSANFAYSPDNSPYTLFAAYRRGDDTLYSNADAETVQVGLRFNFGTGGSLLARSRSGASYPTDGVFVGGIY